LKQDTDTQYSEINFKKPKPPPYENESMEYFDPQSPTYWCKVLSSFITAFSTSDLAVKQSL